MRIRLQRGVASVEAALALPLLVLMAVFAYDTARIMLIKQDVTVEARTAAWRNSLLDGQCVGGALGMVAGRSIGSQCSDDDNFGQSFISELQAGPKGQELMAELRAQVPDGRDYPAIHRGIAQGQFSPFFRGMGQYTVMAQHSVDARKVWERVDMPVGYDHYLRDQVDSDVLFPDFFPNADQARASGSAGAAAPQAGDGQLTGAAGTGGNEPLVASAGAPVAAVNQSVLDQGVAASGELSSANPDIALRRLRGGMDDVQERLDELNRNPPPRLPGETMKNYTQRIERERLTLEAQYAALERQIEPTRQGVQGARDASSVLGGMLSEAAQRGQ